MAYSGCKEAFAFQTVLKGCQKLGLFAFLYTVALTGSNSVNFKWSYRDKNYIGEGMEILTGKPRYNKAKQ